MVGSPSWASLGATRKLVAAVSVLLMAAGAVAIAVSQLFLAHHGGSCATGNTAFAPRHKCSDAVIKDGALFAGAVVGMTIASFGIVFALGVSAMFVALGAAFLVAASSVAIESSGALIVVIVVWGLLGIGFFVGGLVGVRGELRAPAAPSSADLFLE